MCHKSVPASQWPVASKFQFQIFSSAKLNCHPERSRAKSEAIGPAESKDPYSSNPHYFFFFFAADFFGAAFFACACATCFLVVFPGRAVRFTSSPPSCAFFTFFSFFTSSGAL